jgi:hypothetical protein
MLEAEPVCAWAAIALPIKTRMIRKNLNAGADDEYHEKEVEEMQQPQPQGKARIDRA